MPTGTQSYTVEFTSANRKFDWLEISLVFDKSEKLTAIYDSCNGEAASALLQSVLMENIANIYSVANKLKDDINNAAEKHKLYKQFVAWNCN